MKKNIIIILLFVFLAVEGVIMVGWMGMETPVTPIVRSIQSIPCRSFADKLLAANKATHPFQRCEKEIYKVADSNKSVSRVYVVAGAVTKRWEFECGYMGECARYVGWFDEEGNLFDFVQPPDTAGHDPAVYTLGCGAIGSGSVYDKKVKPEIVFKDGEYWWQIKYDNFAVKEKENFCNVSGTSLIGTKEVFTDIKVEYSFDTEKCDPSNDIYASCSTAKALKENSVSPCKYIHYGSTEKRYNQYCVMNFISRTGDLSLCGIKTAYGEINCEYITAVRAMSPQEKVAR